MECMKCGRQIGEGQVFCPECRSNMEQYPVKSETVVQLPQWRSEDGSKKNPPRRRVLSDQEQLQRLSLANKVLRGCVIVLVLLAIMMSYAIKSLANRLDDSQNIGKNYSTVESAATNPNQPLPPKR